MTNAIPPPNLEAFLTKVSENVELQTKVKTLADRKLSGPELSQGLAALSRESGTPVSAEVWQTTLARPAENELPDDALKNVAGGASLLEHLENFVRSVGGDFRT